MLRLLPGVAAAALMIVFAIVLLWPVGAFAASCAGQTVTASWYGLETCHGRPAGRGKGKCQTASGVPFDGSQMLVAHRSLAFGTKVRMTYHGRSIIVPVLDRGPFVKGRTFDLSHAVAKRLGMTGVQRMCAEIIRPHPP